MYKLKLDKYVSKLKQIGGLDNTCQEKYSVIYSVILPNIVQYTGNIASMASDFQLDGEGKNKTIQYKEHNINLWNFKNDCHPDRNSMNKDNAEKMFKLLNALYEYNKAGPAHGSYVDPREQEYTKQEAEERRKRDEEAARWIREQEELRRKAEAERIKREQEEFKRRAAETPAEREARFAREQEQRSRELEQSRLMEEELDLVRKGFLNPTDDEDRRAQFQYRWTPEQLRRERVESGRENQHYGKFWEKVDHERFQREERKEEEKKEQYAFFNGDDDENKYTKDRKGNKGWW
jgi:hypothetical protein